MTSIQTCVALQWECALSSALLLVVRDAPLGCELLLASMLRVVADLRVQFSSQGQFSSAAHPVMSSYHLTLQWILMVRMCCNNLRFTLTEPAPSEVSSDE